MRELDLLPEYLGPDEFLIETEPARMRRPGLLVLTSDRLIFLRKAVLQPRVVRFIGVELRDIDEARVYADEKKVALAIDVARGTKPLLFFVASTERAEQLQRMIMEEKYGEGDVRPELNVASPARSV